MRARASRRVGAAMLVALAGGAASSHASTRQDAFARSLEHTAAGDYAAALESVSAEGVGALPRARARLWAFHHAGLLDEALAEAEAALALEEDAWLRERAVELSVALHDAPAARRHLTALESAEDAERASVAWAGPVGELVERDEAARRGERRARWVVGIGALLCGVALAALARGRR